MSHSQTLDRAKGVLAGLALGDALGRPVEGLSPAEIRKRYGDIKDFLTEKPGGSDDTEYAIATALALIKNGRSTSSLDFAKFWIDNICVQQEQFLGAGFSEMLAISNLNNGILPPESGIHIHSWSDGLAMRVAPIGIVGRENIELTKELTLADGQVSHDGEGIESGLAIALAISFAMSGVPASDLLGKVLGQIESDSWTFRALMRVQDVHLSPSNLGNIELINALIDEVATHDYAFADFAPEAVALAFAAILFGEGDFAKTILFAVNLGRDADTIAAMAGAIIGGVVGHSQIPSHWRESLLPVNGTCLHFTKGINPVSLAEDLISL